MDEEVTFTDEEKAVLSNGETPIEGDEPEVENNDENVAQDEDENKQDGKENEGEEPEKKTDKGDEKLKFVPLGALHEEREERKKAQKEAAEKSELIARMEERFRALLQTNDPQQQNQKPQVPDPESDFVGYVKWLGQTVEQQKQQQQQQAEQRAAYEREAQREQLLQNVWAEGISEAVKEMPDVNDASNFIFDLRDKQLTEMATLYPELNNPLARQQQMKVEISEIIDRAVRSGQNPAMVIYNLAKSNGYQGKPNEQAGNFDKINEAQNRSKTLAASSGQSIAGEMTLEKLASLSDAEFSAWKEKNPRKFERIMSGQ